MSLEHNDKIEWIEVGKLKEHPENNNKHPKEQIERLAKVIKYQGFRSPITVSNLSGYIVAGHARLKAAKELDMTKVPVSYQDFDDSAQEYAHLTADNALALWSKIDMPAVEDYAKSLNPDFDLEFLGFNDFEIVDDSEEEFERENAVPGGAENEYNVEEGDVWKLGEHRLMCGSSTDYEAVQTLFGSEIPNLMVTDPPYGVEYEAGWRAEAKGVKKTKREEQSSIQNDDKADWEEAYNKFPGNVAYVWHASAFTDVVMNGLRNSGMEIKAQIIWNKNVHALSRSDYQWKHEPCWYAVRKGEKHNFIGDRKNKTIWDIKNVMFEKDNGGKTSHPTQKPLDTFVIPIKNHLQKGEAMYDPFSGSGTCFIAAEKTKRKCFGMELDPKFCSVIIKRWEDYTKLKAEKIDV